jgi:Spy/CpxP family protein refolding chaperone
MKLNRNVGLLVVAIASIGAGAAVATAAETTSPAATAPAAPAHGGPHRWHGHHGGGMLVGMTLRATKQLGLTAEQQASIKTILSAAHAQQKAARAAGQGGPVDLSALANPGDPNYATALQSAKTFAANRIQQESELQGQIYNVLTASQKAQLPAVIASMKAKMQERRAAWQQKRAAGPTGAG